jgi:hypothetical protein
MQGRSRLNHAWDAISQESAVLITAAQWQFDGLGETGGRPFLGEPGQEPNVYVTNIGPHGKPGGEAGGVEYLLHIESESPIHVVVTFTVFDPVESIELVD